ncbi:unnamed protein product [Schistocephalus solidus]|uniref:Uncharacterized protein n=1 Tax=Schistocephalus solidus TaxID=70667 RepID=A0A183TI83_SCHSO|nr:unnamed protein product [Schistocephalus solidus]
MKQLLFTVLAHQAETLKRCDNHVSRELLDTWFSGPQSINKRADLLLPYFVLKLCLSRLISHVRRAQVTNTSNDSQPNSRVIITPISGTDDETLAINDSGTVCQATIASISAPSGDHQSC